MRYLTFVWLWLKVAGSAVRSARDTLFADVSSYQVVVNDQYPYRFLSFRSNDGTYRDSHFSGNFAWAINAVRRGKLFGFIVYFVWEENWQATVDTLKTQIGRKHNRRMAIMCDIERWSGKIAGNHSGAIRDTLHAMSAYLFALRPKWQQRAPILSRWFKRQDSRRVIIYGNAGDLNTIAPGVKGWNVVLADYSSNPPFPRKIAHQFSSSYNVPPFGKCDINSADDTTPRQLARKLGMSTLRPHL